MYCQTSLNLISEKQKHSQAHKNIAEVTLD